MLEVILVITIIVLFSKYVYSEISRPKGYPPGPNFIPFFGNSLQLKNLSRKLGGQWQAFEEWGKQYKTQVLGLKLAGQYYIIALTYDAIHEVHRREEFDGRPDTFFMRLRNMGQRLGITCVDGPLWLEHRNFTVRHLREAGFGRQRMITEIQNELSVILQGIENLDGNSTWPGKILPPAVLNVLWTFVSGERIPRSDNRLQQLLVLLEKRSKAFDISGGILSQFPWLRFIAPESTGFNLINRFNGMLKEFFMETINEHQNSYSKDKVADDLIYAYLHEMKNHENNTDSSYNVNQLIMIILDIFIAGSQTTSTTLDLALMITALYPSIQMKIQDEIDSAFNNNNIPDYHLRAKVPYTQAVLMEVQRFFHIIPVSGPRRVLSSIKLQNYEIPCNTITLMSLYSVHMDKNYWGDPETFRPDRFLNSNMEIINTERLMPFGQGRRRCLGEQLARSCLFTFFVGILQRYKLIVPSDANKPILKLLPGITLSPVPYTIKFVRR